MFRNSPCPVLTVGPHVRPREEADFQIRQILCPSDLTERSFSAVPYAISMAAECSAHLTLLHVVPEELAPEEDAVFAKVKLNGAMQRLFPAEARPWSDFEIVVQSGKPADVIAAVAKTRQADLIVLGVRTADALITHMEENTAYRVVTEAECPVMTVPEKG
jgi:nucleotide-binding universal stress UspA family protein